MINSYLHEIIPLKSVKNPLSDKAYAPRLNLEKISKIISSILIENEYFLEFKRQWYKHLWAIPFNIHTPPVDDVPFSAVPQK